MQNATKHRLGAAITAGAATALLLDSEAKNLAKQMPFGKANNFD